MWTEHRFISFDETPCFYHRFKPKSSAEAILIIVHGMGEHGGRYLGLAKFLADSGIESVAPDLRGFGQSGGKRGSIQTFLDYHYDLAALHAFIERHNPNLPIYLLGHSFGGLVCASYLAFTSKNKTTGLILTSPIFGIAIPVPLWRHFLGLGASFILPNYSQSNRVNPSWLTHDKTFLEQNGKDTLIHHEISARLYRELVQMMARKKIIAEKITIPTLVLQAGEDKIVSRQASEYFFKHLTSKDKTLHIYENFYHEILNEVGRAEVFSRISEWLQGTNSSSILS